MRDRNICDFRCMQICNTAELAGNEGFGTMMRREGGRPVVESWEKGPSVPDIVPAFFSRCDQGVPGVPSVEASR